MGLYRKATPDELVAPMLHASVETVETVARECALYRHFDEKGALLYVGVALTPASRLRSHVQGSPWARNVATVTIEWFPSDALAAERGAISGEAPKHNVRRPVARAPLTDTRIRRRTARRRRRGPRRSAPGIPPQAAGTK
jgi:hypothetical protein